MSRMKGSTASLLPEEKNRGQGFSVWKRYSGTQYTHTAFSRFPRHLLWPLTQETLGGNQHDKNQCNRHRKWWLLTKPLHCFYPLALALSQTLFSHVVTLTDSQEAPTKAVWTAPRPCGSKERWQLPTPHHISHVLPVWQWWTRLWRNLLTLQDPQFYSQ